MGDTTSKFDTPRPLAKHNVGSSFLHKLFCQHDWKTHHKEKYEWDETRIVEGTQNWYAPKWETQTYSSVTEILICRKCGKIRKIEY